MSDTISCANHGENLPYGFVCRHVYLDERPGWNTSGRDELCPDAWCDACEVKVVAGGWDDATTTHADIRLVCAYCYHHLRGRRLIVPELATSSDEAVVRSAREVMAQRNQARAEMFSTGRYWFDLDEAVIEFRDDVRPVVVSRIIALGTFSETAGTWLAAWANRDLPAASAAKSAAVGGFLVAHGLESLAREHLACSLHDAWGRAAVGALILDAIAVYRCPSEGLHVFFALLDARRVA